MELAFSTHWPDTMPKHLAGKQTNFMQKIFYQLLLDLPADKTKAFFDKNMKEVKIFKKYDFNNGKGKKHTLRKKSNRWFAGRTIHFVINPRSKNRYQFCPMVPVTSVQNVQISYKDCDGCQYQEPRIYVDGSWLTEVETFVQNDGFDCKEDFFAWFNTDQDLDLIHWTNLKY